MWIGRATTRWRRRCRGFLSVVVDEEPAALPGARPGRRHHRHLCGPTACSARCSSAAAPARARVVEVSMLEAMAHFAVEPYAAYFALGTVPKSRGPAAPGAGPHPAHEGWRPDRHPSFVAGKILDRPAGGTGRAGARAPTPRFSTRLLRIENYDALGAELDGRFSTPWLSLLHSAPAAGSRITRGRSRRDAADVGRVPQASRAALGRGRTDSCQKGSAR